MAKRIRSTMNVSLPAAQKKYIEKLVESGDYQSASEVMRECVRAFREREEWIRDARKKVAVGMRDFEAGRVTPADDVMAEWRRRDAAASRKSSARRKSA